MTLGAEEREAHRPPDYQNVGNLKEAIDHGDLVRPLGPADDGNQRPSGLVERAVELGMPAVGITAAADEWSVVRDDALAVSAVATGRLAALASRVPVVPAVIILAVLLAVTLGLISPGVFR